MGQPVNCGQKKENGAGGFSVDSWAENSINVKEGQIVPTIRERDCLFALEMLNWTQISNSFFFVVRFV